MNVLTDIPGRYTVEMVTENLLALLWVVLLGMAGLGKMSDKRYSDALSHIHCTLTPADRTNIAALLHGQTDPYKDLIPIANDGKGADSSADTSSSDSDSDSVSGSGSGSGSGSDSQAQAQAGEPASARIPKCWMAAAKAAQFGTAAEI